MTSVLRTAGYSSVRTFSTSVEQLVSQTDRKVVVTTTDGIANREITQILGMVQGVIVRVPTIKQGIIGNVTAVFGGKNVAFTQMCKDTRQEAFNEMIAEANKLDADAIVGVRYVSGALGGEFHSAEVVCYGTAVKLKN